jgi:2-polyprenyl-6-methoxyphenol hydroxylase-like FAD-dependent oxidoreductase
MISTNPSRHHYDVIVIGARPAGAGTAMLLAQGGVDVLVLDKSALGSDTLSTHALLKAGVYQLHRWGLIDQVIAAGTPPAPTTVLHAGRERISVEIRPFEDLDALYAPRRTVLDPIIVGAGVAAGAEFCFERLVEGPMFDSAGRVTGVTVKSDAGESLAISADLVIGADGMYSRFAKAVEAPVTAEGESAMGVIFGYFDSPPDNAFDWYFSGTAAAGTIPTNGDQTLVFAGTTTERFKAEIRADTEAGLWTLLDEVDPELAPKFQATSRDGRLRSFPGLRGYMKRPWGPGWALVGDAGYFKDPLSAHGLTDALRDAEILARAVLAGDLAEYETTRNDLSLEHFVLTDELACFCWDSDRVQQLLLQISKASHPEVDYLRGLSELTS